MRQGLSRDIMDEERVFERAVAVCDGSGVHENTGIFNHVSRL